MGQQEQVNILRQQEHILIRKFERHEIEVSEYDIQMRELMTQIQEINIQIISRMDEKRKETDKEDNERRIKMAEEKVKEKKEKVIKESKPKVKRDSYASVILEVLQLKTVKNVDTAADKVLEKKPGRDKDKVKSQITVMINEVKKGKKPAYTWDAENYQLNLK